MTNNNIYTNSIFRDLADIFKRKKRMFIFGYFVFLSVIIILFFALPWIFPNVSIKLFNGFQEFAVPYNSEIVNGQVRKKVLWLNGFKIEELNQGDLLAVIDSNTNSIWIEEVVNIDWESNEVITSFDGLLARRTSFDNIKGLFDREASAFGVFYYSVSSPPGLIIMTIAIILSLLIGYYGFVNNVSTYYRKFKEKYQHEKISN